MKIKAWRLALPCFTVACSLAVAGAGCDEPSEPATTKVVGAAGGTVTAAEGVAIEIPEGALSADTEITVEGVSNAPTNGWSSMGSTYRFGPEGLQFAKPVTVTLPVDASLLPIGKSAADLVVLTAPAGSTEFVSLGASRVGEGTISATTTHFSDFLPAVAADASALDGGTGSDAGTQQDAGEATDGGTESDAGTQPDAGEATDGGTETPGEFVQVSARGSHVCALTDTGTVKCWGYNSDGQLGDGTTTNHSTPVAVGGLSGVVQVETAQQHTCALLQDKTVKCWGSNEEFQLGDYTSRDDRLAPVAASHLDASYELQPVTGVARISLSGSLSSSHSCALLADGSVVCWGAAPVRSGSVPNLTGVQEIAAGGVMGAFDCARLADGSVSCWGANGLGMLGDGTAPNPRNTPGPVSGISGVAQITAGDYHACALLSDKTVRCWGSNDNGQLGDGTTTDANTPVAVSGLTGVKSIAANHGRTCAIRSDDTVACWGRAPLGNGTTSGSPVPVAVSDLTNVAEISLGNSLVCARRSNGTIWCWGGNLFGEVGDGTTSPRLKPVQVTQ